MPFKATKTYKAPKEYGRKGVTGKGTFSYGGKQLDRNVMYKLGEAKKSSEKGAQTYNKVMEFDKKSSRKVIRYYPK